MCFHYSTVIQIIFEENKEHQQMSYLMICSDLLIWVPDEREHKPWLSHVWLLLLAFLITLLEFPRQSQNCHTNLPATQASFNRRRVFKKNVDRKIGRSGLQKNEDNVRL